MAEPIRPRGHFAVAVSGYKLRLSKTFHVFPAEGGGTVTVPDVLLPATQHEPGSMRWWEDLWVVGDNPRERLCKFPGSKPYRNTLRLASAGSSNKRIIKYSGGYPLLDWPVA